MTVILVRKDDSDLCHIVGQKLLGYRYMLKVIPSEFYECEM